MIYDKHNFEISIIKPTSFYSREHEKTKLNWFCYEIAIGFFDEFKQNLGKKFKKKRVNDDALAKFSIYLAKAMKDILLQQLSGEIETVEISYEMVESYFPRFSDKFTNKILDSMHNAWEEQLSICVTCPTRCISEKDEYCTIFNEYSP